MSRHDKLPSVEPNFESVKIVIHLNNESSDAKELLKSHSDIKIYLQNLGESHRRIGELTRQLSFNSIPKSETTLAFIFNKSIAQQPAEKMETGINKSIEKISVKPIFSSNYLINKPASGQTPTPSLFSASSTGFGGFSGFGKPQQQKLISGTKLILNLLPDDW